jgi:hypothetical protein
MQSELPPVSAQRRLPYRPSQREVHRTYDLINRYVFNNRLTRPQITLGRTKGYWGMCIGSWTETRPGTYVTIKLSDKWYCPQWFINTLAHEMVHQYQWDVDSIEREQRGLYGLMSHGPSFFMFRDDLERYGISLKTAHGRKRWFKHQDFTKC